MKIKNTTIIYLLQTVFLLVGTSCNKMLSVKPQSKLTQDQFWKNRDEALAAVAGIYATAENTHWDLANGNLSATDMSPVEAYIYWGEMRGDLLAASPGKLPTSPDQSSKENVDNLLVSANDITTKYTHFYRIIDEANLAIKYIPNIVNLDPSLSKTEAAQLVGEAYFLRAYAYFWLARTFKDVPLVLVPSETDAQNYNVAKSTQDVIFAQILKDLTIARNTLPEWYSNTQYPRCRATQYSALAVLSDVELWIAATSTTADKNALYDKVITNCDSVINSGRFILLPGTTYASIFTAGNTSESIFESYSNALLNTQTNNLNNWYQNYFAVPSSVDNLFYASSNPDYRSFAPPTGAAGGATAGAIVSYNVSTRVVLKYNVTTNDARWIFYRYPDILFMKAEALAHRYPDDIAHLQLACDLVNQVRARAFGIPTYTLITPSTTIDMDNALLDERGREFVGEGKRWFDLVRFGSRDGFAHPELLTQRVITSFSAVLQLIVAPRVTNPDSWYMPLNQAAIDASAGKLIQNKYYQ